MTGSRRAVLVALLALAAGSGALAQEAGSHRRGAVAAEDGRGAVAAEDGRGAVATYLANEGFLLEATRGEGDETAAPTVLVDALFGDGLAGYATVPPGERARLERGAAPYDRVGVVLATHVHRDHFAADAVAAFLRARADARFLSTPQAVAEVRRVAPDLDRRLTAAWPAEGGSERHRFGAVGVEVLRLHHGEGTDAQNLGFVIELGGVRVLHVGDTEAGLEDFAAYDLAERRLDLALLPDWYLTAPSLRRVVREQIPARRLVAMHLAEPDAPARWFGAAGSREARLAGLRRQFPEATLALEPGTRIVVSPAGDR